MKQLTIGRFAMSVYLDGESLINLPLTIPENVLSLNWFDNKEGTIFFMDETSQKITELPAWANACVDVFKQNLPKPNPDVGPTLQEQASNELYATDWTSIPDITDPAKCTPHLTNQEEFLQYRNQLRAIALGYQQGAVKLPEPPNPKWSTE